MIIFYFYDNGFSSLFMRVTITFLYYTQDPSTLFKTICSDRKSVRKPFPNCLCSPYIHPFLTVDNAHLKIRASLFPICLVCAPKHLRVVFVDRRSDAPSFIPPVREQMRAALCFLPGRRQMRAALRRWLAISNVFCFPFKCPFKRAFSGSADFLLEKGKTHGESRPSTERCKSR